jgi:hypothetical protein
MMRRSNCGPSRQVASNKLKPRVKTSFYKDYCKRWTITVSLCLLYYYYHSGQHEGLPSISIQAAGTIPTTVAQAGSVSPSTCSDAAGSSEGCCSVPTTSPDPGPYPLTYTRLPPSLSSESKPSRFLHLIHYTSVTRSATVPPRLNPLHLHPRLDHRQCLLGRSILAILHAILLFPTRPPPFLQQTCRQLCA